MVTVFHTVCMHVEGPNFLGLRGPSGGVTDPREMRLSPRVTMPTLVVLGQRWESNDGDPPEKNLTPRYLFQDIRVIKVCNN